MTTHLDSLKNYSLVVADTGDIDAVARWKPQDATTNPSLLLASAEDPRYQPLVDKAIREADGDVGCAVDALFVQFGVRILKHVDDSIKKIAHAREGRYELVVLSDHGQIDTIPFTQNSDSAF